MNKMFADRELCLRLARAVDGEGPVMTRLGDLHSSLPKSKIVEKSSKTEGLLMSQV